MSTTSKLAPSQKRAFTRFSLKKRNEAPSHLLAQRLNVPLLLGTLIVLLVAGVAIAGPALAPRDPTEMNRIIKVGDSWETPPFPAFEVPGFPLGSDGFGRDILSRLLYAVRPTMIMVVLVAVVRLTLGVLIGVLSGWFSGRFAQVLEWMIAGALSMPVLMMALVVIAAVGVELGIWAFIFGLGVTGWAETARAIQSQTREVKGQVYVEASHALGASNPQVLWWHVLRQILPRAWLFLPLEISSTLMTTAGLGFLGYYIGGDVWIEIEDYVAARISGQPELGQMLATSISRENILEVYLEPWGLVMVGSVIFVTILGFQLLGEGIRRQFSLAWHPRRSEFFLRMKSSLNVWLENILGRHIPDRARGYLVATVGICFATLSLVGGFLWWQKQDREKTSGPLPMIEVPGGHLWAADRHDPFGTKSTHVVGPSSPQVQLFFKDPTGLAGGPAVSIDGTLYLATNGGMLYALDPKGSLIWGGQLPAPAIGAPALSAGGDVYVADKEGNLSTFTPSGELRWTFQPEHPRSSTAGPIVSPEGNVYYNVGSRVLAVSPQGELKWQAQAIPYELRFAPLHLSPAGDFVFWEDLAFNLEDGSLMDFEVVPATRQQYFVGAGGGNYVVAGSSILAWHRTESGPEIAGGTSWNADITVLLPDDVGVTPEESVWVFYSWSWGGRGSGSSRLIWLDMEGRILNELDGILRPPAFVVGIDGDSRLYLCGMNSKLKQQCSAHLPKLEDPIWQLELEETEEIVGGALVPGRLYVATNDGSLFVFGDPQDIGDLKPTVMEVAMSGGEETETGIEPSEFSVSTEEVVPTPTPLVGETTIERAREGTQILEYVVQPGDWVWKIAREHGVDPNQIIRVNSLEAPYILRPGQILWLLPKEEEIQVPIEIEYVVQSGDWVYAIARKFNIEVWKIIEANNLMPPYLLLPGDILKIPYP